MSGRKEGRKEGSKKKRIEMEWNEWEVVLLLMLMMSVVVTRVMLLFFFLSSSSLLLLVVVVILVIVTFPGKFPSSEQCLFDSQDCAPPPRISSGSMCS